MTIKFSQRVELQCSTPECKESVQVTMHFRIEKDGVARFKRVDFLEGSQWRVGRFIPGPLHPSNGGIPEPGKTYKKPGLYVSCPEHVEK